MVVARGQRPLVEENFVFCKLNMHNFRPLSVKICHIYDFRGGKGANLVFGGLNLHNFRPFFNLTFYKDIGFFLGGSRILQSRPSKY